MAHLALTSEIVAQHKNQVVLTIRELLYEGQMYSTIASIMLIDLVSVQTIGHMWRRYLEIVEQYENSEGGETMAFQELGLKRFCCRRMLCECQFLPCGDLGLASSSPAAAECCVGIRSRVGLSLACVLPLQNAL